MDKEPLRKLLDKHFAAGEDEALPYLLAYIDRDAADDSNAERAMTVSVVTNLSTKECAGLAIMMAEGMMAAAYETEPV